MNLYLLQLTVKRRYVGPRLMIVRAESEPIARGMARGRDSAAIREDLWGVNTARCILLVEAGTPEIVHEIDL